jgi:TrmH family RNA methyltransferase
MAPMIREDDRRRSHGCGDGVAEQSSKQMAKLEQLALVLVRTRNPLNIGAVARAMQNFGVRDLRLVAPFEASFREARSAVGAGAVLGEAREFASLAEAVADCRLVVGTTAARRRELRQTLLGLEQAAEPLYAALAQGRVALLFGSEKHGLTREDLEHCHWLVRIATEDAQPSMNLGQAVAVCLWELARERDAPVAGGEAAAISGELERLGALLMELLEAGGYVDPKTATSTAGEVRRLLRRLHVTDADTHLLMGMVRKLLWKVRSER